MALLQALCPAVIASGAVRVHVGSGSLAAAAGTDAVRMASGICPHPMVFVAVAGAGLSLFVM